MTTRSDVRTVLAALRKRGGKRVRDGMSRYGIVTADEVLGVSMAGLQEVAKPLGRDHALAAALWQTGCYEARMLATMVDDPALVTATQMERWCRDFDNWATCDTACFKLFDRSPHAWRMVAKWCDAGREFVRRAAFALLASLALHDKASGDAPFLEGLRRVERAATDERNFVKKGVNWALRAIGKRNPKLRAAATKVAMRLAGSKLAAARWIGKDALRDLRR